MQFLMVSLLVLLAVVVSAQDDGCAALMTCALCISGGSSSHHRHDAATHATTGNNAATATPCAWCLSSQSCAAMANGTEYSAACPLTSYTDCCFLKTGSCSDCTADPACSYCSLGDTVACIATNSSQCLEVIGCLNESPFSSAFIFGGFIAIAGTFTIGSFGLLIYYTAVMYRKNIAHQDLDKLYRDQKKLAKSLRQMDEKKDKYTSIASLLNVDTEV